MKSLHCIVKGKVRGGNFQHWVRKEAEVLGLTGWVRNLEETKAEILAQGDESKFARFEELLRTEPPLPSVEDIHVEIIDYDTEHDVFEMRG